MSLHIYKNVEQGTDEWHDLRRGIITASVVGHLISVGPPDALTVACPTCKAAAESPCFSTARKEPTPIKSIHEARAAKASTLPPVVSAVSNDATRALTALLAAERITGYTEPTWMTSDMFRGVEDEPRARDLYSKTFAPVTEVGFMVRADWGFSLGYSPDGLVGDDGLIEVKSRRQKNHLLHVIDGEIPTANMAQLQGGLLVTGRKWIDYLSFCGGMKLWRKRVYPDPAWHEAIVAAVAKFETTAAEMVAAYEQATTDMPATERIDLEVVI